jgi:hypothetical protein
VVLLLLLIAGSAIHAATIPAEFTEHVIAADLIGGSQVVIADLNKDGKPDIIALASGKTDLIWFENPSWKRHVLAVDLRRMSNVAVGDIDGDGIPEVIVAHEFTDQPANSLGIISVLQHGDNPREPWKIVEIDRIPTSHRLRWADVFGNGAKALVNAPLTGPKADGKTSLVMYKPGVWMRETIPQPSEGAVRGIYITDWDADGAEDILTAGYTGIHVFRRSKEGVWSRTEIAPTPAAEIAAGWLGSKSVGTRFLAAVNAQVFVFRQDAKGKWQQQTIDDTLLDGGAILTADLNGDGNDEIIVGYRGQNRGVNAYYANPNKTWTKYPLDNGGIAAADCAVADLNADGRPDVVCIGSDSANLKWYENKGSRK